MGTEARARLGLAALLGATLFCYELVFEGDAHSGPTLVGAGLAMAIVTLARRWGAGSLLSAELSLAGLVIYLTLVFQVQNSLYGLPTPAAATGLSDLVARAYETSQTDVAPVPVRAGYVVMIVVGMWLAATIGELATFRWRRPLVATLPCIGLIAPTLVVGTGIGDPFFIAVFLAALFTYWSLESTHRLRTWGRWVTAWEKDSGADPPSLTGALARRMGASCIAATLVAPVFLPTLGEGWFPWKSGEGDGPGSGPGSGEVNLLVDARPRAISQSNASLFEVTSSGTARYWRLASLSHFDGRRWTPGDTNFETHYSLLPRAARPPARALRMGQDFRLTGLGGDYLPAAVEPFDVEVTGNDLILTEVESRALRLDGENRADFEYSVVSDVARPTFPELLQAEPPTSFEPNPLERAPGEEYYELPELAPEVEALADEWTRDYRNPFLKLIALQTRLRADFTYSTDVASGASSDYLRDFLLETKTGFCQQFAAAFAVLARIEGFPARVSVGFLPGEAEYLDTGEVRYTVRGTDAHAWPEVYFEDYGWLAFEPTPRALSSPPTYTTDLPLPGGNDDLRTRLVPGGSGPANDQRLIPEELRAPPPGAPERRTAPRREPRREPEPPWRETFGSLARAGVSLGLLWLIGVPLVKRTRTLRRYGRAANAAEITRAAYRQFEEDAAEMATGRSPWQSPSSFADRLARTGKVPEVAVMKLTELYEAAEYSAQGVTRAQAAEARKLARHVRAGLWTRASLLQRARALFSARVLVEEMRPFVGRLRLRPRPAAS